MDLAMRFPLQLPCWFLERATHPNITLPIPNPTPQATRILHPDPLLVLPLPVPLFLLGVSSSAIQGRAPF